MNTTAMACGRPRGAAGMHAILWSVLAATWLAAAAPGALAQGSRKDDIIFGPSGHPVAGATVRVCQPAATGTPCLPLATIYTDATLTVPSANPFQADGIGNYHFYAPAGRYEIQISSPQISGTITQPDVILPPDLSTSGAGNNISAFGLTLGGNLSVAGNTTISGTLTTANFNPGAFTPSSLSVTGPGCMAGPRPSFDVTCPPYNAVGDAGILNGQNGSITAGTNTFTVSTTPVSGWHTGMGISINGAGASGASLVAKVGAITGNTFTLVDNSGNPMNAGTTISGTGFKDDDTLAIQAALAAACATPTTSGGRDVFFPPANYAFTVAQNTTAATFTTCQDLYLHGANAASHNGVQFGRAPTSVLLAQSGSIPGSGPTIDASYPNGNEATVANLTITGYNTAFYSQGAPDITLDNDNFSVNKTGLSGNAGVHLSNLYWARILGGSIQTGGSTHPYPPALLLSGDACSGCTATVINFRMQDTRLVGGNIQYVQTTPENASQPGYWEIDNADTENQDSDYLSIINSSGSAFTFGPIKISRASVSDASTTTGAIINFHGAFSTDVLSGVTIDHSTPADDNFSGAAVIMSPGTLTGYQAIGCGEGIACATLAEDSSGKIVGTGYVTNQQGIDYFSNTSDNRRLTTNPFFNGGAADGPSIRATQNGNPFASYGLDALNGFMFSTGAASGWMSQLQASSAGNIDVAFAQTYPPTGLTGTPSSTGGTLAAGTYYIYGASDTIAGDNCNTQSALSAASNIAGPFVLTGSTSSIALSWTPAAAGLTQINGYCFLINSSNVESPFAVRINSTGFVSGASSNSVTVTTTNASTGVFPVSQMAAAHHITPAGSVWNGDSTPLASAAPPYIPACLAGTTCSGSLALSPVVADSFVRANASTLGANWTVLGGVSPLAISSNSASVSGGSYGEESWNGQMFAPDQWSRAKINTLDGNGAGVMVRAAGAGTDTAYLYFCSTTSARSITKRIAGTSTTLATAGSACSVGDTLELDVAGTTLIGIHNGSVDLTATDSSIASGAPGISVFTSGNSLVSWIGGNLPAGNGAQSLFNQPNTWPAAQTFAALGTASNCNSSASPAACGPAIAGSVAVPTGTTPTLVVDTSGVTANSQIT